MSCFGICGTDAKADALLDLGFSSALNYKSGTLAADLDAAARVHADRHLLALRLRLLARHIDLELSVKVLEDDNVFETKEARYCVI